MATEQLLVRLKMDAHQYKNEARGAARATGAVAGEAKNASTETSRLDRQLGNTGVTMRTAIKTGAVVAGAALVGFAKDSVRAAVDLGESINAVRVVFGEAADDVLAIGKNSADSFGLANSEFNAFAVRFSAFAKNIAAGDGRGVGDVLDELTGRVADFASVMNIDVADAAQKFQSGLAGEVEPLRKFGIDVSAAATAQKALELGLADTTAELTEGDKVLARYQLIMEQTEKTAGDFKNTQDDLANATRTLSANFEDFKARAGAELTPVLGELAAQGIQLFDILDPDVDLGWTQRLSAGIQLVTGEGSEAVKTYIEQKTAANELETAAHDLTDEELRARDAFADVAGASDDAADGITEAGDAAEETAEQTQSAADAVRDLTLAFLEAANPIFAAQGALDRYEQAQANLEETRADTESTARDIAAAELEVAEAALKAEAALIELGGGDVNQGIEAIADALGKSEDEARELLEILGVLDGTNVTSVVTTDFRTRGAPPPMMSGGFTTRVGGLPARHSGGRVEAGKPYVWQPKDEMLITSGGGLVTSRPDTDRIVAALERFGGAGSSTHNYNMPLHLANDASVDPQLIGAVHSVLRRMETM